MMKKLWTPILVFIILLIALISTLVYGIRIESFTVGEISVRQLYIKLDKKLIVEALHVKIPSQSSQGNAREEIVKLLEYLPWLNRIFDTISIGKLEFADEVINFAYKRDVFYLDSNYMTIDAQLNAKNELATIYLKQLLVKDFELELKGELEFDIYKEDGFFEGSFETHGIQGNIAIKLQDRLLSYVAQTDTFKSLEPFMKSLEKSVEMAPEISEWVYQRIHAKEYKINSLSGKIDLQTGAYFPFEMRGNASAKNVSIRFNDNTPSVLIDTLGVRLENNQLLFDINKAQYEGIDLSRSSAYIYNLLTQKNGIVITIRANSALDGKIHKILKSYKINLPLEQPEGTTEAVVELDIRFLPYDLDAKGYFVLKKGVLEIDGEPFGVNHAYVTLNNRDVFLDATRIRYKNIFDITTEGVLDTRALNYAGTASINNLVISYENRPLIQIGEALTPVLLDFNEGLHVSLPEFETMLHFKEKNNQIDIKKLSSWASYAPILDEFQIGDGNVKLMSPDFESFSIKANLKDVKTPLIKDGEPLEAFDVQINVDKDGLKLTTEGLRVEETRKKRKVFLENIDVNSDTNLSSQGERPMELYANNSRLFDKNGRFIEFDNYKITTINDSLNLDGNLSPLGTIKYYKSSDELKIDINNLNDLSLNKFAQKTLVKDGKFSLLLRGNDEENYSGNLSLKSTYLLQMNAYNNLIALINTLPSLALFKSPGFNENGYEIKSGNILFTREGDILTIHAIELDGISADISGKGIVNLKDDTLHIDLQLKTLKDVSGLIGKIPLISHIVLGEDKSIATGVTLSGDIRDPDVETQVLQDTLVTPFNILRRTIELPFKIFSD